MATENKTSQALTTLRNMATDDHSLLSPLVRKAILAVYERDKRMESVLRCLAQENDKIGEYADMAQEALSFDPL